MLTGLLATRHLQLSAEIASAVLPEFGITVRNLPDIHVVALHGELDVVSAEGLCSSLLELAGSTLVVDLSGLTFMDSSGIGAVVRARNRIRTKGRGDLVLTRPGAIVLKTLEIVGLSAWIVDWSHEWGDRGPEHRRMPCCGSAEIATHFERSRLTRALQWESRCSVCKCTWRNRERLDAAKEALLANGVPVTRLKPHLLVAVESS